MKINWLDLWDELYKSVEEGKTSWGKLELLAHMTKLEKEAVRKETT